MHKHKSDNKEGIKLSALSTFQKTTSNKFYVGQLEC